MGPFQILVHTETNTCLLGIPARWCIFPEFNLELLHPSLRQPDSLCCDLNAGPPFPAAGQDCMPEHVGQELLKFMMAN